MSDVASLRTALEDGRAALFAAIRGLSEEQFRTAPPDSWNIATHLAHLLRCERMYVERMRRALEEHEPLIASSGITNDDDPALAQRLAVPQIVHGLQASRRELMLLLGRMDAAALERAIMHEPRGRITVSAMLGKAAAHEAEHAGAVATLARQAASARRVTIPLSPRS